MDLKLKIKYRGETIHLSSRLAEKQNLSKEQVRAILNLHKKRVDLFLAVEKIDPTEASKLSRYVKRLERLEFQMQREWGFPTSKEHHTWWNQIPHCICKYKLFALNNKIDSNCPLHGDLHRKNLRIESNKKKIKQKLKQIK